PVAVLVDPVLDPIAARRRATTAGLVRDGQGDALVERGGEQGRLAVARVSGAANALVVDLLQATEVIDRPMDAPGPQGDGAAFVVLVDERCQPTADVLAVGVDVAAVERGDGVAALDGLVDGPDLLGLAAAGFERLAVLADGVLAWVHPGVGQADLFVIDQRVV